MAMLDDDEALIICNGYKDEEYIETALLASKLGRTVIIVVEKFVRARADRRDRQEDGRAAAHRHARQAVGQGVGALGGLGRRPLEVRPVDARDGRGDQLPARERPARLLRAAALPPRLPDLAPSARVKNALREAGRFYVELCKLGAPLKYLDVGGGLGVDYDGSQTNFASSMNYTMQEYANDIVFALQEICDAAGVPHPTIVTESGRAVVAHHSVLVVDILGVGEFDVGKAPDEARRRRRRRVVQQPVRDLPGRLAQEPARGYHDALEYKEEALQLFNLGHLSLDRARSSPRTSSGRSARSC